MKVTFTNGLSIKTTEHPEDCNFIDFENESGTYLISASVFTDSKEFSDTWKDLAKKMNLEVVKSENYDSEYVLQVGDIQMLFDTEASYVRVSETQHKEEFEGSYWTVDEFVEAPMEVLGALAGSLFSNVNSRRFVEEIIE